ncbi:methyl-accepting chemotaxis protein [Dechloromonas sp. ZY10]|uniref:methyl-accepting chemotaxis protein n=1 Tax=Dechloromonas aquae TaxID=2664436 RepID=UPI00352861BD
MRWFNNQKIWLRLVGVISAMLLLLWSVTILWTQAEQQHNAEVQAREFAGSVHQMTLAALTAMMMTGSIDQRQLYLDQIRNTSNIHELEVFRGEAVAAQYGPGLAPKRGADADELAVLRLGSPVFRVEPGQGALKAVLPIFASSNYLGKNCLGCHSVREGAVMGAVSMKISLEQVNAQARDFVLRLCGLALLLAVPFLLLIYGFISRAVTRPLERVIGYFDAIGAGRYDNRIEAHSRDEVGTLLHDLDLMQQKLRHDVAESRRVADETMRIKVALDNATTNVMIADNDGRIIYLNRAVCAMLRAAEADLRRDLPNFTVDGLLGENFDVFHRQPAHQRQLLAALGQPHRAEVRVGGRVFRLIANPVVNERGERLGTSVEWLDATQEVAIQQEVQAIVAAALTGDLQRRVELSDKQGFMRELGQGINALLQTNAQVLGDLQRLLSALARGDLTEQISADYHGIYGELKDDANATVVRLQEMIGQVRTAVESINTAAGEIASGNTDLAQRTEEQATSLEHTVTRMEELTQTVEANAANAARANQMAIQASEAAARGGEVVGRVVSTMETINEASRRIGDIIGVIDGIAFQTNLLALNAAVEAARAGEQGRGFAVVATEVRKLAQRSAEAAREIKGLIDDSATRVDAGSRLVEQAGVGMGEIVTAIAQVTGIMGQISTASSEQSTGIGQVNQALAQMDDVTQQNAALVEEAAAAAESLEEQARNLSDVVALFRLDGAAPSVPAYTPAPLAVARLPAKAPGRDSEWAEF